MALLFNTRDNITPSFRISAIRTGAEDASPALKFPSLDLFSLYPDVKMHIKAGKPTARCASTPLPRYRKPMHVPMKKNPHSPPSKLAHLLASPEPKQHTKPVYLHRLSPSSQAQGPPQLILTHAHNTPTSHASTPSLAMHIPVQHTPVPVPLQPRESRSLPSPPVSPQAANVEPVKACISCKSAQSPCWRPSWDPEAGQLCNSCGLRYKKTGARCLNKLCGKIPSKGEWSIMKKTAATGPSGNLEYACLVCEMLVDIRQT